MVEMITNDPASIRRTHLLNPTISLRDSHQFWPLIEARCSYKLFLVFTKACISLLAVSVTDNPVVFLSFN